MSKKQRATPDKLHIAKIAMQSTGKCKLPGGPANKAEPNKDEQQIQEMFAFFREVIKNPSWKHFAAGFIACDQVDRLERKEKIDQSDLDVIWQAALGLREGFHVALGTVLRSPMNVGKFRARVNAAKRVARDPKTKAKLDAHQLWLNWQHGSQLHKSGAAFARFVVDTLPIESEKTVERWMREWRAQSARS